MFHPNVPVTRRDINTRCAILLLPLKIAFGTMHTPFLLHPESNKDGNHGSIRNCRHLVDSLYLCVLVRWYLSYCVHSDNDPSERAMFAMDKRKNIALLERLWIVSNIQYLDCLF